MFTSGEALNVERRPDSVHSCSPFGFVRNFLHYCSQFDPAWAQDDKKSGITDDELKTLHTIIVTLHVRTINMSLGRGTAGRRATSGT